MPPRLESESGRGPVEKDFGTILRKLIQASGISLGALSKAADVSENTISTFLAGGDIRLSEFSRLYYAFDDDPLWHSGVDAAKVHTKKPCPNPGTMEVINLLKRKIPREKIVERTGKSAQNIRTIFSRYREQYEL